MSRLASTLFTAALAVAAAACATGDDDDVLPPLDTRAQLAEPATFYLAPADAKVTLRATFGADQAVADLVITSGTLEVAVDDAGRLVLDDLTVAFDDVALPSGIYPGDLVLTNVHVHLAQPVRCADTLWADDDEAATCAATAELMLDWDVVIGGTLHPMASQTIGGLELAADLYRGDDLLVLDVAAHADGLVWSYLDLVTLSDLDLWFRSFDRRIIVR